ncbi:MAG: transporter substrate-binding domain-containing protein [Treponema sp.]|jgi:signal transduction histidine kinase/CheY-like chemotaxis protein|nr:transporter substrate-binding domain-containing protein [Treponema sp.]
MKKNKVKINIILPGILVLVMCYGCTNHSSIVSMEHISFRDIPGVTDEEIKAIEELQKQYSSFVFGATLSTESFFTEDGEIGGYIALLNDWLTALFDIEFIPEIFVLSDMLARLTARELDFGIIRDSEERREIFNLSDSIAHRIIKMIRLEGSLPVDRITMTRPLRYAFLENSTTYDMVSAVLAPETYEALFAADYDTGYQMLKNGSADAFLEAGIAEAAFDQYVDVYSVEFLPLLFNSVVMATANQELAPIISIVTKALQSGGNFHLNDLYRIGYDEYKKQKLFMQLNEEERTYIQNNPVVRVAAEYYFYPISFFNPYERKWEGIAFDILNEIEKLSSLKFEVINDQYTEWPALLELVHSGEAQLITLLVYTEGRSGNFLWPRRSYMTSKNALLSKQDFPNINIVDIPYARIGLIKDMAYTELFLNWFPDAINITEYNSLNNAFYAVDRGEIDLVMINTIALSTMTNYYEFSGYKANFIFNLPFDYTFGYSKDQSALRSIIDKALLLIDTDRIVEQWVTKTYDYESMLLRTQRPWLIGAIALSLIILTLVSVLLLISRKTGRRLEKLVKLRTGELQLLTEEARSASRSKSAFLAVMSHEIRTPMNSIMGFAELAIDSDSVVQTRDYLGKITDSTKWLLLIINNILDISKIEAGKMELERVPFDFPEISSRCQSVILPAVKEKGLELSVYTEPLTDKKLLGDPVRLYQVLINLLSNAVKFTDSGTVKFSSTIKNLSCGNITMFFEVKDSGIGMTAEQVKNIFEPFAQADSSTTRDYGGTGLGLAIARNIVELMGGKLLVDSSPGAGSTFSFELTFETIYVYEEKQEQAKFDMLEKPYFEGLVLVCDDNLMNQEVICTHLERVGLKTLTADNGKLGVEIVQERKDKNEKPFNLIFMDMYMPVMDGIEAAVKINALDTGAPMVAMTANIMTSELEKYRRNGMPDCLGKPFTSQELWHILLKYLKPKGFKPSGSMPSNDLNNDELQTKLRLNFVKNNQTKYNEISNAIAADDIKLAHRLAHTLKGNAGMIGKTGLRNAAAELEELLKCKIAPVWESKMNTLNTELMLVLEELKPLLEETAVLENSQIPDSAQVLKLFEKLSGMLENLNPECIRLLDEIRVVPGTEELTRQIESYEFEAAAATITKLKTLHD